MGGDLTEGFLRYEFGGLIRGGAYFRNFTVTFVAGGITIWCEQSFGRRSAKPEKEMLFSRQKNGGLNSPPANTLISVKTILPATQAITEVPRTILPKVRQIFHWLC